MKPVSSNPFFPNKSALAAVSLACALAPAALSAAIINKDDDTDDLNLATSWTGAVVPGTNDVARWSGLAGANSVLLGGNLAFQGITIATTGGAVSIGGANTLTLGSSGIDMSAANQDLSITSNLALATGGQTWNVATGRLLTLTTGTFTRNAGATLNLQGAGTISSSMTGLTSASLTNGILAWATVGTGTSTRFAGFSGSNLTAYTGATVMSTAGNAWGGMPSGGTGTVNYDITINGTPGQTGLARNVNSIRYTGTGLVQQGNNTGVLLSTNAILNAGTGVFSLATGGGSIYGITPGSTNELVLAAANAGITVNAYIANNGTNAGRVTVTGPNTVTLSGTNTFTGDLVVNSGTLSAGTGQGSNPASSNLGALQPAANRNLIVNSGGTLSLTGGNVLGTGGSTNTLSNTTLVVNAGGLFRTGLDGAGSGWWNKVGATNLNGGTIRIGSGANTTTFQGLALIGTVTAGGSTPSSIENFAASNSASNGVHLGQNATAGQSITFDVADVSGSSATDLSVSTNLLNTSANLTASGLTKTGAGTMTLTGTNAYTGATVISGGTLQIGAGGTAGSLSSASAITNNAALVYNRSDSFSQGSAISGSGSLTKLGAGTLTLTGALTHGGATSVSAGTLAFTTSQSSIGALSVSDSAGLSVRAESAGTTLLTTSSLTLGSAGITDLTFDFKNLNTTAPLINTGAFTANGTVNVSFSNGALLGAGSHTLIDYSSFAGAGVFPSGTFTLSPRSSGQLVNDLSGTALNINVATDAPKWTGLDSGNWVAGSTGASSNWKLITGGTATDFIASDVVLFDDSAMGSTGVDISAANVSPTTTTFDNSALNYTLFSTGGFGITTGSLTKSGTGSLTINTTNTHAGGTILNAGTLNISNNSALGTGTVTIAGGAIDNTSGGAMTLATNNAQNWNGDFAFTGTNDLNMGNGTVTLNGGDRTVNIAAGTLTVGRLANSGGGFIKNGAGTLQLNPTAASSLNGTLTVNAGTLGIGSQDLTVNGLAGNGTIQNGSATTRWLFVNTTGGSSTFGGTLQDGGTGRLGLNVFGGNTLTTTGALNLTDRITVNGATTQLIVNGASSGAAGTVFLEAGGSLVLNHASALASNTLINLNGAQTASVTYGSDGGDNVYQFSGSSNSTLNLVLDRATAGTDVTHAMSTPSAGGGLGGGTFMLNLTKGGNVSGTATASFNQFNLGGGTGGSTTINPAAGVTVNIGSVTKSNNNVSQTLVLGGVGTAHEITGAITNGAATGTNNIALAKSGTSTWTLSGNSTYTGATTVSAGTLLINGSLGNTAVTVTGGTLGGSGSITGTVAVSGTLSPGNSIESLATGALTMSSGSSYVFEVADNSSAGADLTAVNGTLSLTGVTLDLDASSLAALAGGSWTMGDKLTLFSYLDPGTGITSGFNGYLDDTAYAFGSNQWLFDYNDTLAGSNFATDATASAQNRFVTMTLVPEPSAALLGAGGLLVLLRRRRR